jgi:hypothetical protein
VTPGDDTVVDVSSTLDHIGNKDRLKEGIKAE